MSWGDHLSFGEGDGRLGTPDAVRRRLDRWQAELVVDTLHWRVLRSRIPGRYAAAPGHVHPSADTASRLAWTEFDVVPALAHDAGLRAELYVSIFDEGWPLAPPEVRAVSHHNAMHGRDVAWQSDFSLAHPHLAEVDRSGTCRQWGVLTLAEAEVRAQFVDRISAWLRASAFDGVFVCLRSQSKPAAHADEFGYGPATRCAVLEATGHDILGDRFDVQAWRDIRGGFLTEFLRELRGATRALGRTVSVGAPRGDVLGPPLGNLTLDWRTWMRERLVDALVIDQNSSRCPSMWHDLWPMHRGVGYLQNYLTGEGLPSIETQVRDSYGPQAMATGTALYLARQWSPRDAALEAHLRTLPGVTGLVFSTFRHDNAGAVRRGDWTYRAPGGHD